MNPDQTATRPYPVPAPPTRLVRQTPTQPGPVQPGPAFYPTQSGPRPIWTRPEPAPAKAKRRRPWWRRWYTVVPAFLVAAFITIGAVVPPPSTAAIPCKWAPTVKHSQAA